MAAEDEMTAKEAEDLLDLFGEGSSNTTRTIARSRSREERKDDEQGDQLQSFVFGKLRDKGHEPYLEAGLIGCTLCRRKAAPGAAKKWKGCEFEAHVDHAILKKKGHTFEWVDEAGSAMLACMRCGKRTTLGKRGPLVCCPFIET